MGLKIASFAYNGAVFTDLYVRLVYNKVDFSKGEIVVAFDVYANKATRDADIDNTLPFLRPVALKVIPEDFAAYFALPYETEPPKHFQDYGYNFAKGKLKGLSPSARESPYSRFIFDFTDSDNVTDVFEEGQP